MQATELTENLFQAVDTIIDNRIQSLPYDQTIKATVLYVYKDKDGNNTGKYYLQSNNGPARFEAYGTLQYYKVGEVVYVRITGNDLSAQKIITGLEYTEKSSQESITLNSLSNTTDSLNTATSELKDTTKQLSSTTESLKTETEELAKSLTALTASASSNAAVGSATVATALATITIDNAFSRYSVGDTSIPVYFKDGHPVECTSVSAIKLSDTNGDTNKGSASKPVYFQNGIPVECTSVSAINLNNINAGNGSIPVYFQNGVPKECTSVSAVNLNSINAGNELTPVFFKDGNPQALTGSVGTDSVPIYLKDGTFTECTSVNAVSIGSGSNTYDYYSIKALEDRITALEDKLNSSST